MNLLPTETKKKVHREYQLRFLTIVTVFLFFSVCAGVIASIPFAVPVLSDYFLAQRESKAVALFTPSEDDHTMLSDFQAFKDTLNVLDPRKTDKEVLPSDIFRLVMDEKPLKVVLTGFLLTSDANLGKHLQVSGVAGDRESLVAFSRRLSSNKAFLSVDFPLSNLSKKEDIEFSMTALLDTKGEKEGDVKKEGSGS